MLRNPRFNQLKGSYLFPEIAKRKRAFQEKVPEAKLISLGVGDTTEPIPNSIVKGLAHSAESLGSREGYRGYGPEQGVFSLREKIASVIYKGHVQPEEVFVSDGAKCDISRLQLLFGSSVTVGVQDPAYPVYVDGSILAGVKKIHFFPCTPENNFFPDLEALPPIDLLYFCSPNNPTGAVATKEELEKLVAFAKKRGILLLFDAAYSSFIQEPHLPRSIYEIPGAEEVAIEINSFSKIAGFTGVRLGWVVVPKALKYSDGSSIAADWNRVTTTIFNGASIISQAGGEAILEPKGQIEVASLATFYLENARLLRETLSEKKLTVYGGTNAPYLWVHFPERSSWDVFQELLEKYHLVTTPGAGFGPAGEGFIRFSAFGSRHAILEARQRLLN